MSSKQRIDYFMAEQGIADSRTKAAALIMAGRVFVEGKKIEKAGYFVKPDEKIEVTPGPKYVSRAGGKLASVAKKFRLKFDGAVMLDVGSSTGGFTDFALQNGAKLVYAVDVGTNQLDWRLRKDSRIELHEKTDIRKFKKPKHSIDIVTIDVSFISLRRILPHVSRLMSHDSILVAMCKPQFEADYKTASTHKGVIKNDTIRRAILKDFEDWAKEHFQILDKADSEVHGTKGNIERFYLLQKYKDEV